MNQLSDIIKRARERKGLNKSQAAQRLGISSQLLGQYESDTRTPKTSFFLKWKEVFHEDLLKQFEAYVSHETNEEPLKLEDPAIDYGQPIIQVVLNLSYIGKKNADSIERMAATNERNTEIIAALVQAIVPNSSLSVKQAASPADQYTPDDLPAEAFLNHEGIAGSQSKKKQPDKPASKGK